jgi:hypothetical protein
VVAIENVHGPSEGFHWASAGGRVSYILESGVGQQRRGKFRPTTSMTTINCIAVIYQNVVNQIWSNVLKAHAGRS